MESVQPGEALTAMDPSEQESHVCNKKTRAAWPAAAAPRSSPGSSPSPPRRPPRRPPRSGHSARTSTWSACRRPFRAGSKEGGGG